MHIKHTVHSSLLWSTDYESIDKELNTNMWYTIKIKIKYFLSTCWWWDCLQVFSDAKSLLF